MTYPRAAANPVLVLALVALGSAGCRKPAPPPEPPPIQTEPTAGDSVLPSEPSSAGDAPH